MGDGPTTTCRISIFSQAPEAIARMSAAYEEVLRVLQLADRQDPITELVAKKVIDVCQSGERPREHLRAGAAGFGNCQRHGRIVGEGSHPV